jgi:hypothetical protein
MNQNDLSWISWAVLDANDTESLLNTSASSSGHWKDSDLTVYGIKVREYLKGYPSVNNSQ